MPSPFATVTAGFTPKNPVERFVYIVTVVDDASAMAAASGADLDPTASMDAEDAATLAEHEEDGGEGIMAKLSSMPTWGWVAIVGGVGALFFFRSANGRRFLQRITKRKGGHGPSTTGAAAAK